MINVTKVPYTSIEVEIETGEIQVISENNKISFITESNGELKKGIVTNMKGAKSDKVKIEFIPENCEHRETWEIIKIQEGSLRLVEENDEEEEIIVGN